MLFRSDIQQKHFDLHIEYFGHNIPLSDGDQHIPILCVLHMGQK